MSQCEIGSRYRVDRVEEGSVLRRPTSETTNSLSVSDRPLHLWGFLWRWETAPKKLVPA
jgi:hypothetical protein